MRVFAGGMDTGMFTRSCLLFCCLMQPLHLARHSLLRRLLPAQVRAQGAEGRARDGEEVGVECVHVCACVCACVRACVRVFVRV